MKTLFRAFVKSFLIACFGAILVAIGSPIGKLAIAGTALFGCRVIKGEQNTIEGAIKVAENKTNEMYILYNQTSDKPLKSLEFVFSENIYAHTHFKACFITAHNSCLTYEIISEFDGVIASRNQHNKNVSFELHLFLVKQEYEGVFNQNNSKIGWQKRDGQRLKSIEEIDAYAIKIFNENKLFQERYNSHAFVRMLLDFAAGN
ncbi:UNKNOWN [Stylonychia lemnae]|uniref:Uncharacterized protein n=1 Tax=Stylonychia lemnae TaxID=5949 RepID=A0A078B652_STYLE|nr:UNKNOWN [Stylonychia lemnae]|eukprot:CDW89995.1 UNKNOWN [Stylonychia lemnae]